MDRECPEGYSETGKGELTMGLVTPLIVVIALVLLAAVLLGHVTVERGLILFLVTLVVAAILYFLLGLV